MRIWPSEPSKRAKTLVHISMSKTSLRDSLKPQFPRTEVWPTTSLHTSRVSRQTFCGTSEACSFGSGAQAGAAHPESGSYVFVPSRRILAMLFTSLDCPAKVRAVRGCPAAGAISRDYRITYPFARAQPEQEWGEGKVEWLASSSRVVSSRFFEARKCSCKDRGRQDLCTVLVESQIENWHRFTAGICMKATVNENRLV